MLTQYREKLHLKKAVRGISLQKQKAQNSYFSGLQKVIVLLDATDDVIVKEALAYIKGLDKKAGNIKIFGYIDSKAFNETLPFDGFCKKDLDWIWRPKRDITARFKEEQFDLLINLCQVDCFPLEYLATSIEANYKIGALTDYPNNYDSMVEARSLDKYSEQVTFFIGKYMEE